MKPSEFIKKIETEEEYIRLLFKECYKDAKLDDDNLEREITKNIEVQIKWNVIKSMIQDLLNRYEEEYKKIRSEKYKYWKGMLKNKPKKLPAS